MLNAEWITLLLYDKYQLVNGAWWNNGCLFAVYDVSRKYTLLEKQSRTLRMLPLLSIQWSLKSNSFQNLPFSEYVLDTW